MFYFPPDYQIRYKYLERNDVLTYLIFFTFLSSVKGQFDPYQAQVSPMVNTDNFEKELCRERWHRLDWQSILKPCLGRTKFGENLLPGSLRTNPLISRLANMDIQKAGDYSKLTIQTIDQFGMAKIIGGDTWRVLIKGPASLQPIVHDMNNGFYEIPFLIMEPGLYKADIYLEGTLCSQYFDPPTEWFQKGDYNGHFQEAHMFKNHSGWPKMLQERLWERLGGALSVIQFQVFPRDESRYLANMAKLHDWETVCKIPQKCNFLWDGFGRWVGKEWKPYDESDGIDKTPEWKEIVKAKRRKRGSLWLYGDCFAHHFYEMVWNKTLCRSIFEKCGETYNWVYPRLHPVHELDPSIHRKDPSDISIEKIISYVQSVLDKDEMDDDSAIVLNFGLHLTRSTSFESYQKLIVELIKALEEYDGEAVFRTTTSVWKQQSKVHKRFQTNQRVQLFNAFASSAMCNAEIPVLDVFQMTASTWNQPEDGIHYENYIIRPINNVLLNYFKDDVEEKK